MRVFEFNVLGYKNYLNDKCSQDFSTYKNYRGCSIFAVADGHSLNQFKFSHVGSRLACEAAFNVVKFYLEKLSIYNLICDFENKIAQRRIKKEWRKLVYEDFYKRKYKAYRLDYMKYGTTLSFFVFCDEYLIFFNLGDGNILMKKYDNYELLFENNNYRFVNSLSHFDCENKMQYKILKNNYNHLQIVLSTDGFINSFNSCNSLILELNRVSYFLNKDVFFVNRFRSKYIDYLKKLSKNKSFDDISIMFVFD